MSLFEFISTLLEPLSYLLQGNKRIYWLFLLSAALLGVWHSRRYHPDADSLKQAIRISFSRKRWLNRSTAVDISLLFLNHSLRLLLVIPVLGSQLGLALWCNRSLYTLVGDPLNISINTTLLTALFTLCFFIADDLSRFVLHYAMHKLPWLWRYHRLHHSAEQLTPLTLYRFHPVEMALLSVRSVLVGGLVSGVFIYCFAGRIGSWDILGANAFGFLFNACAANLRHSHIPLSFGLLERWFISPAQHQLHHSRAREHRDINFGSALAVWDRALGCWRAGDNRQRIRFGLDKPRRSLE